MQRLLLLIPTLDRSGAEKQLTLLASRLPRDRFDPYVVCLTRGGPYEEVLRQHDVPVTILGKRAKFDPLALRRFKSLLWDQQPDILHTWLFAANAYGRMAIGSNAKTKVIVSERCVDSWKAGWQLWMDRRLIPRTDMLVGNSQSVADFYRDLGVPAEKLRVIPNGVELPDLKIDRFAIDSNCETMNRLGFPPDAKIVGFVGRLAKQKRLDDLLWALQVLRQAEPRSRMIIVGDGPERDRLLYRAQQLECAEFVKFVGHQEEMSEWWPLFDVFWLSSDFEGMSNSLMEAMAHGLPVIVSDIPPNRELVDHDEQGYVIPVGDGVAFAQYTVKLFGDDDLARRLGAAGHTRIESEFSVERMVQAYVALYESLLVSQETAKR